VKQCQKQLNFILSSTVLERAQTLLRSLDVAQAVLYRCYTDTDIVLSLYTLFFAYFSITIITVLCYHVENRDLRTSTDVNKHFTPKDKAEGLYIELHKNKQALVLLIT